MDRITPTIWINTPGGVILPDSLVQGEPARTDSFTLSGYRGYRPSESPFSYSQGLWWFPRPQDAEAHEAGDMISSPRRVEALRFLRSHPRLERRLMTCLRLDTAGFTKKTNEMDPTVIREYRQQLKRVMVNICDAHGGVYKDSTGDGYQFVWGIQSDPDDAFHAVTAALRVLEWSRKFNGDRAARGEEPFEVRIGLDTGLATPELEEITTIEITGPLMARTQRTEDFIKRGDPAVDVVCVTKSTLAFCGDRFATKPRGILLGKDGRTQETAEEVHVFEVLHLRPTVTSLVSFSQSEGQFVGRPEEMKHLQQAARSCFEQNQSSIALVIGDQGIGKTRLLSEFFKHLDDFERALTLMSGQGINLPTALVNHDIVTVLKNHFKIEGLEDADAFRVLYGELTPAFAALPDEERAEMIQLVSCFLGISFPDRMRTERMAELMADPKKLEQLREESLNAVLEYFDALLRVKPVVMILDDLQWFDRGSLKVLEILKRHLAHRGLFILGAVRGDAVAALGWTEEMALHQPLEALPDAELSKILSDISTINDERLKDHLIHEAQGNPYQLHDLVRAVRDFGWGLTADGHLKSPDGKTAWSGTGHFLAARLDQLKKTDSHAYDVLSYAAVIDGEFSQGDLERLQAPVTDQNIAGLIRSGLIVPTTQGRYRFATDQLRETAYARLSPEDIKIRHRAYLKILRAQETEVAVLAHHLERSGELEEAADLYYEAAETAYFKKNVIEIADDLYAGAWRTASALGDLKRQWKILRGWDQALFQSTQYGKQEEIHRLSMAIVDQLEPTDKAGAHLRIGRSLTRRGKHKEAAEQLSQAWEILESAPNPREKDVLSLKINILIETTFNHVFMNQFDEARQACESAEHLAKELKDNLLLGRTYLTMNYLSGKTMAFVDGLVACRRAVEVYKEENDLGRMMSAQYGVGVNLFEMGRYIEAEKELGEAARIARENFGGKGPNIDLIFITLGYMMHLVGKVKEAIEFLEDYRRENPNHHHLALHLNNLASAYLDLARLDEAEKTVREALGLAKMSNKLAEEARAQMILAQLYLKRNRPEDIKQAFTAGNEALKIYQSLEGRIQGFDLEVLLTAARICNVSGREEKTKDFIYIASERLQKRNESLAQRAEDLGEPYDSDLFLHGIAVHQQIENFEVRFMNGVSARHLTIGEQKFLDRVAEKLRLPDELPKELNFDPTCTGDNVSTVFNLTGLGLDEASGQVLPYHPIVVLKALFLAEPHIPWHSSPVPGLGAKDIRLSLQIDPEGIAHAPVSFELAHKEHPFAFEGMLWSGRMYEDYEVPLAGRGTLYDGTEYEGIIAFHLSSTVEISVTNRVEGKRRGIDKGLLSKDLFGDIGIFLCLTPEGHTRFSLAMGKEYFTRDSKLLFVAIRDALLKVLPSVLKATQSLPPAA